MSAGTDPIAAASKAVVRTVITFMASVDLTVAMAFPAYMGRSNVSLSIIPEISANYCTSSNAARLGKGFFPTVVDGSSIWL